MFEIAKEMERIVCLKDRQAFLNGIEVSVRLYAGLDRRLSLQSIESWQGEDRFGPYQRYICHYEHEADSVRTDVIFNCYESFVIGRIKAEIGNQNAFGAQRQFAPEQAVSIKIREIPGLKRLMANYRHKPWWCRPFFGDRIQSLPPLTQCLLWQEEGQYGQILPVCDRVFRTDISGNADGMAIQLSSFVGGLDRMDALSFILGAGGDPYRLAAELAGTALQAGSFQAVPREEKDYPVPLEYLGWCTWDAFYHEVNEKGILEKAEEFKNIGLPVKWVMIDDGWSQVKDGKLASFEAEPDKFPLGLKAAAEALKAKYGVHWVGVWHTIAGYWAGIDPESEIGRQYTDSLTMTNSGKLVPAVDLASGFGFWNAWHAYLKRQGIDFVKVDSQSAVNHFHAHHRSVGEAARGAHDALEASAALHFDSCIINCMGMASENIWHRAKSAVSRNSDDFVPKEQDSFREHALQNAYNSFYHGEFYWGDWDMYWTDNHDDRVNMVLRAVSGGPVYISDAPGQTKPEHILPLVYRDGRIIRCEQPGRPTPDCLLVNPSETAAPLKIWNTSHGAGIVAAFHVHASEAVVEGTMGPKDVPDLSGNQFIAYDIVNRRVSTMHADEEEAIQLKPNECALVQYSPILGEAAIIGLVNKLVPMHAVENMELQQGGLTITLKEGGDFALVCDFPPTVQVNGAPKDCMLDEHQPRLYRVDCSEISTSVKLEITWR